MPLFSLHLRSLVSILRYVTTTSCTISSNNLPSKLLENELHSRISLFIHQSLDPFQSDLRSSHSTGLSSSHFAISYFLNCRSRNLSCSHSSISLLLSMLLITKYWLKISRLLASRLPHFPACSPIFLIDLSLFSSTVQSVIVFLSITVSQKVHPWSSPFNLYMSSSCSIPECNSVFYHIYADNIQLIIPLPLSFPSFLSNLLSEIPSWCVSRNLLLDTYKS